MAQESAPGVVISCPLDSLPQNAAHYSVISESKYRKSAVPTARFRPTYFNVPESMYDVIEAALEVWEKTLISRVPINLYIYWDEMANTTLASAKTDKVFKNFVSAPLQEIWYPAALAEAITGKNLNGNNPDIILRINKKINWDLAYKETLSTVGKYDLFSVVLHEIAHGIGFLSSFHQEESQTISWGISNFPYIFDQNLEDQQSARLTDHRFYTNGSAALRTAVTQQHVYFKIDSGGYKFYKPQMHTVDPFKEGVSLSHISNAGYSPLDANDRLMYPSIAWNTKIRDLGKGTLAILYQMGWALNLYEFPREYPSSLTPLEKVIIFPNPTTEKITVVINASEMVGQSLQIFDTWGRLYHSIGAVDSITEIDLSLLQAGSYILKIKNTTYPFIKF